MCGDSGVDSVLITNRAREARQKTDFADSYVPFEPPQSPGADFINTENMFGKTIIFILVAGLICGVVLLSSLIAHGNAIPSTQGGSHAQQGR